MDFFGFGKKKGAPSNPEGSGGFDPSRDLKARDENDKTLEGALPLNSLPQVSTDSEPALAAMATRVGRTDIISGPASGSRAPAFSPVASEWSGLRKGDRGPSNEPPQTYEQQAAALGLKLGDTAQIDAFVNEHITDDKEADEALSRVEAAFKNGQPVSSEDLAKVQSLLAEKKKAEGAAAVNEATTVVNEHAAVARQDLSWGEQLSNNIATINPNEFSQRIAELKKYEPDKAQRFQAIVDQFDSKVGQNATSEQIKDYFDSLDDDTREFLGEVYFARANVPVIERQAHNQMAENIGPLLGPEPAPAVPATPEPGRTAVPDAAAAGPTTPDVTTAPDAVVPDATSSDEAWAPTQEQLAAELDRILPADIDVTGLNATDLRTFQIIRQHQEGSHLLQKDVAKATKVRQAIGEAIRKRAAEARKAADASIPKGPTPAAPTTGEAAAAAGGTKDAEPATEAPEEPTDETEFMSADEIAQTRYAAETKIKDLTKAANNADTLAHRNADSKARDQALNAANAARSAAKDIAKWLPQIGKAEGRIKLAKDAETKLAAQQELNTAVQELNAAITWGEAVQLTAESMGNLTTQNEAGVKALDRFDIVTRNQINEILQEGQRSGKYDMKKINALMGNKEARNFVLDAIKDMGEIKSTLQSLGMRKVNWDSWENFEIWGKRAFGVAKFGMIVALLLAGGAGILPFITQGIGHTPQGVKGMFG